MKKGVIFLLGIISFCGINQVKAEEIKLEYNTNVSEISSLIDNIGSDKVEEQLDALIESYSTSYSTGYPFYFISFTTHGITGQLRILLTGFSEIVYNHINSFPFYKNAFEYRLPIDGDITQISYIYNSETASFELEYSSAGYSNPIIFSISTEEQRYNPYSYYYSNFDLYYKGSVYSDLCSETTCFVSPDNRILIPAFGDPSFYAYYNFDDDFIIEPYYLFDESILINEDKYITIDLNQYSYVILSLKDYSFRDTFTIISYIKGQACATPVYNYGTEEKKDYISGWQTADCGDYYTDFTRHLHFIRAEDIKNHAIYYYSAYDFSRPNLIKIDSSVYNVTYITSENENSPSVSISGKTYQTLPYSSLTDSAILTEENGISDTWTCAKYDTDCYIHSSGLDVDDIFNKPLETLKTIWSSITTIFELISEFIALLPPVMQGFLYLAFGLGIAIGLIKIIL